MVEFVFFRATFVVDLTWISFESYGAWFVVQCLCTHTKATFLTTLFYKLDFQHERKMLWPIFSAIGQLSVDSVFKSRGYEIYILPTTSVLALSISDNLGIPRQKNARGIAKRRLRQRKKSLIIILFWFNIPNRALMSVKWGSGVSCQLPGRSFMFHKLYQQR